MNLVPILLMAAAVAAVPIGRRYTGDYFSPAALVVAVWGVALGAFELRLLPYPPLRPDTAWLLGGALVLMCAGAVVGGVTLSRWAGPSRDEPTPVPYANAWLLLYAAIGLLGVALYLREVDRVLGLETLIHRPWLVRLAIGDRTIRSTFLFFEYFCIITPIVAVAMRLTGTRLHPMVWAAAAVCTLATWITTDRTHFFVLVLTSYFLVVFRLGARCSFGRLLGVSAAAGLALLANFLLVEIWVGKWAVPVSVTSARSTRPSVATAPVPRLAAWTGAEAHTPSFQAATPPATAPPEAAPPAWRARLARIASRTTTLYLYATGSIAALNSLVGDPPPRTHGVHTFYPIARALERAGVIAGPLPDAVLTARPVGMTTGPELRFNTYTFLSYPFEDFGSTGAIAYASIVGLVSGAVYGFARRRRASPAALLAIAQISGAIVLSIFVNKFNNTASWYILVCSLLPFLAGRFLPVKPRGPGLAR
jgi:hypothetical protein